VLTVTRDVDGSVSLCVYDDSSAAVQLSHLFLGKVYRDTSAIPQMGLCGSLQPSLGYVLLSAPPSRLHYSIGGTVVSLWYGEIPTHWQIP